MPWRTDARSLYLVFSLETGTAKKKHFHNLKEDKQPTRGSQLVRSIYIYARVRGEKEGKRRDKEWTDSVGR